MSVLHAPPRLTRAAALGIALLVGGVLVPTGSAVAQVADRTPVADAVVSGPLPGSPPGDRLSPNIADTYPFFSTPDDLAARGYVEQEFLLSGVADGWTTAGEQVATDVPYTTRIVVRRPADPADFSGVALVEWQNVTAGYDLDALWNYEDVTRAGNAWIGVSAQRVGVQQLAGWSPARYGTLDVTGGGTWVTDELSYDIFAQAGKAVRSPVGVAPLGDLDVDMVLAIGASQSAGRMTAYYDAILPQVEPVFDGYAFVVGTAPSRVGEEPVFQLLSETDVRTPVRQRPDSELFRRWEVAGTGHSGWQGQQYRAPISLRDLGAVPQYECELPPFSRVPMHHVTAAAYAHLVTWVQDGTPPPTAPYLEFNGTERARDADGFQLGGIRLSQVEVPIALNTGENGGPTFCRLFGSHQPYTDEQTAELYPNLGAYVSAVAAVDAANVEAGYLLPEDAVANFRAAVNSGIVTGGEGFPDVPDGWVHELPIDLLTADGVLRGFTDGTFGPLLPTTRAQMASILQRALELEPVETGPFPDVRPGAEHSGAINALAAAGIVQGRADGTFDPQGHVTRGQLATMLTNAAELEPTGSVLFPDVPAEHAHVRGIDAAHAAGIVRGFDDGSFGPDLSVTRAQTASMMARLLYPL